MATNPYHPMAVTPRLSVSYEPMSSRGVARIETKNESSWQGGTVAREYICHNHPPGINCIELVVNLLRNGHVGEASRITETVGVCRLGLSLLGNGTTEMHQVVRLSFEDDNALYKRLLDLSGKTFMGENK